jgi:phosphate transport system protein
MALHLKRDLDAIQRELFRLALDVEEAIQHAARCVRERDAAAANLVIAGDSRIDEEETRLEEDCLKVLALHQPVAIDLRRVVTAIKINSNLERMADLAEEIAERAVALASLPPVAIPTKFQLMTDMVVTMVRQALDAFFRLDAQQARRVARLDDEVDRFNREIIDELLNLMKDPAAVDAGLSLFSATRHLERIADYATNIVEDVVYLVEGTIIRHRPEALSTP